MDFFFFFFFFFFFLSRLASSIGDSFWSRSIGSIGVSLGLLTEDWISTFCLMSSILILFWSKMMKFHSFKRLGVLDRLSSSSGIFFSTVFSFLFLVFSLLEQASMVTFPYSVSIGFLGVRTLGLGWICS